MHGYPTLIMKTEITNQQNKLNLNLNAVEQLTQWLMTQVQALNTPAVWTDLSLVILDNQGIQSLNQRYFQKAQATDVISFAYLKDQISPFDSGEVFVNAERALEMGAEFDGISHELALYIAHGCHHLSGADDQTEDAYNHMRQTELTWLKEAHHLNLIEPLLKEQP